VPLSPSVLEQSAAPRPARLPVRARRSQRLRALATVLALTAVVLVLSAIGIAAAVLRTDRSDVRARSNLEHVLRAAEAVRRETGTFTHATPGALRARVPKVAVVDGQLASNGDQEVSTSVSPAGDGWFGAVKSRSGRCFAFGTVNTVPTELVLLLGSTANCTGEVARAALMPLPVAPSTMTTSPAPVPVASAG
jgi:hypothetical protein